MKLAQRPRLPLGRSSAFSMLELLLVVAILVVLFTLYWGPGSGSRERALFSACQGNLQKIHVALALFANDNDGRFPGGAAAKTSAEALDPLVPRYNSDTSTFICPAGKDSVSRSH